MVRVRWLAPRGPASVCLLLLAGWARLAAADVGTSTRTRSSTVAPSRPAAPGRAAPQLLVAWEGGAVIKSTDGKFRVKLGGLLQADGRAFVADEADALVGQFALRRVRLTLEGTFFGLAELKIMPDFAGGVLVLQDAYLDLKLAPWLRLRGGKQKEPFGLERLQQPGVMSFLERAYPTQLAPNRDIGLIVHGEIANKTLVYQLGVFNGVADGGSGDGDSGDEKDFVLRVFSHPFALLDSKVLSGLGVGVAGLYGESKGSLASTGLGNAKTAGQATFFAYATGTDLAATSVASGRTVRLSPQAYYYGGPVGAMFEWVWVSHEVSRGIVSEELFHRSMQIAASVVLTGESASYKGVVPERPFDLERLDLGALELAARFATIDFDIDAIRLGLATSKSVPRSHAVAAGINWYLNDNVRLLFNFEHTSFPDGSRPAEVLLAGRMQLAL